MLPFHNVVCSIMCFRVLNFILAVCVLTIFRFICLSSLSHRLGENGKSQGFIYVVSRNPLGVVKICDKMSQQSIQPVSRQFIKSQKIAVQSAEFILWGSKILVRSSMTRLILWSSLHTAMSVFLTTDSLTWDHAAFLPRFQLLLLYKMSHTILSTLLSYLHSISSEASH